jgi:hypothetical protein
LEWYRNWQSFNAPGGISILNQSSYLWTAGISQDVQGQPSLVVAAPLYGNMLNVIAPVEKVLLMFAETAVDAATVIYQSYAPGLFIDIPGATSRTVTFDINNGWGGAAWATPIPPNANLVPILISN